METEKKEQGKKRNYLKYVLHAVILVGVILAAVKYLNGAEVLAALQTFDYVYAPAMLALSAAYILLKGWRFGMLMRPLSQLPAQVFVRGYVAGTAATLLPGGVYARAGLMEQAGVPVEQSTAPVAYSSILDQAIFVAGLLAAALWFEPARLPALIILGVLALLGLVALIAPARRFLGGLADRLALKLKFQEKWRRFLQAMAQVSTPEILLSTLIVTAAGLVMQIVILDLSLRGLGVALPWPTLFLAYILPAMLGRNSAIPAGVGLTEAGMVGFLSSASQMDPDLAAAAAALFRVSTVFFQALLGAVVYFFFWRGEKENSRMKVENK